MPDKRKTELTIAFDTIDVQRARWFAKKKGISLERVVADALYAYCLCIAPEADADAACRND